MARNKQKPLSHKLGVKDIINLIIGLIGILAISYILLWTRLAKSNLQIIFLIVLLALFVTQLSSVLLEGKLTLKGEGEKEFFGLKLLSFNSTGSIALLLLLIFFITNKVGNPKTEKFFPIKLINKDKIPAIINVIEKLKVTADKNSNKYNIDNNGVTNVLVSNLTDSITIELLDVEWQFAKNKNKIIGKRISELDEWVEIVEPDTERCCLNGKILFVDKQKHKLKDIIIEAENQKAFTDYNGFFSLSLKEKYKFKEVILIKAYNSEYTGSIYGNTKLFNEITLNRK